jgi:8-oxo-dGTP pyrophosphatase MutT (NUDIX family)
MADLSHVPLQPAATVVLLRTTSRKADCEVLLLRRPAAMRSFAGAWVFPGGKLEPEDASPLAASQCNQDVSAGRELEFRAAALRETFEETGLLLAAGSGAGELLSRRAALAHDARSFYATLHELGLRLDTAQLAPLAHWMTPAPARARFDTRFFLAHVAGDGVLAGDAGEAVELTWRSLRELADAARARPPAFLAPTAITLLELAEEQARGTDPAGLLSEMARRPVAAILPKLFDTPDGPCAVLPWDDSYAGIEGEHREVPDDVLARYRSLPSRLPVTSRP